MIDSSFYTFLVANVTSGWTVQEGKLDFDKVNPWVWFRRASTVQERLLSGAACDNFTTDIDVEVVGTDIDAVQTEADTLKYALQTLATPSTVGSTFCHYVEVTDHNDDYIPRSVFNTDTGYHVASFQVRILHRA